MDKSTHALELRGVQKRFGSIYANKSVDLCVGHGSIHGIVGENGAGKSTLMHGITGFYPIDGGEIRVNGKLHVFKSTKDSLAAGIGMVHQHFMLVESLSVLENIVLGVERGFLLKQGLKHARSEITQIIKNYGLEVPLDTKVSELGVGIQQRVEILKALYRGADILILDEPTAVLTPLEVEDLFKFLRNLKHQGKTILLVTHKLKEIMAVTDEVTVMKQGEVVLNVKTSQTSASHLAECMVGRPVLLNVKRSAGNRGEKILRLDQVSLRDSDGVNRLSEVSLDLYAGEIVGVAGVAGNGQSELLGVLSGLDSPSEGKVLCRDKTLSNWIDITHDKNGPSLRRKLGISHVPEDRLKFGVVASMTAEDNIRLGYHGRTKSDGLFTNPDRITEICQSLMNQWDIRPVMPKQPLESFSGGNQQKLVMAREMNAAPRVLLIGQPTRGVDIGAIEIIHKRLLELRDVGVAILLVSVELEEILSLADRILVMNAGRITGEVSSSEASEQGLGLLMAGIAKEGKGDPQ